ncbi:myosin light chain kinase, smooth muscle-like [Amphibalanus amphitrite]|uniref:myosin light chain kinase, smooth muscle-like n=1 Tax=Amphibalanus amphitrite TaxID=1232801 RepID=UPI001C913676|nr:myosin light chain kinase, smooth muscle-like [Amphibalanus amphitrite]
MAEGWTTGKAVQILQIEQDGDTFVLKISECFKEDEGIYTCVATNSAGKSTMKAPLKVTAPKQEIVPTVSPMKDVICMEGEPARFVAKITGKPTPTATWLREGQIIPQSGEFKMTLTGGTAVLEICETYSDDTGTITCRATNGAGTSEASARLTVQKKPKEGAPAQIVEPLNPRQVRPGQTLAWEVKVIGSPPPQITWFHEGQPIRPSDDFVPSFNPDTGVARLTVPTVMPEDVGNYTVLAENPFGRDQNTANLIIVEGTDLESLPEGSQPPALVVPLRAVVARPGADVTYHTAFEGLPPPVITWFHNGKPVDETEGYTVITDDRESRLVLSRASTPDEGVVEVVATNAVVRRGHVPRWSFRQSCLTRRSCKLPVSCVQSDPACPARRNSGHEAEVTAKPEVTFTWMRDNKRLKNTKNIHITSDGNKTVLVISEMRPKDVGEYTCVAENEAGMTSSAASIQPRSSPEKAPREPSVTQPAPEQPSETSVGADRSSPVSVTKSESQEQVVPDEKTAPEETPKKTPKKAHKKKPEISEEKPEERPEEAPEEVPDKPAAPKKEPVPEEQVPTEELPEEEEAPSDLPKVTSLTPVIKLMDGEELKVSCKIVSPTPTRVAWLHEGQPMDEHRDVEVTMSPDGVCTLYISEVYPEDAGTFTCRVTNAVGPGEATSHVSVEPYEYVQDSEIASMTVGTLLSVDDHSEEDLLDAPDELGPRFVRRLPRTTSVPEGSPITFECRLAPEAPCEVTWYLNERVIQPGRDFEVEALEDGTQRLTVLQAFPDDAGVLTYILLLGSLP